MRFLVCSRYDCCSLPVPEPLTLPSEALSVGGIWFDEPDGADSWSISWSHAVFGCLGWRMLLSVGVWITTCHALAWDCTDFWITDYTDDSAVLAVLKWISRIFYGFLIGCGFNWSWNDYYFFSVWTADIALRSFSVGGSDLMNQMALIRDGDLNGWGFNWSWNDCCSFSVWTADFFDSDDLQD